MKRNNATTQQCGLVKAMMRLERTRDLSRNVLHARGIAAFFSAYDRWQTCIIAYFGSLLFHLLYLRIMYGNNDTDSFDGFQRKR